MTDHATPEPSSQTVRESIGLAFAYLATALWWTWPLPTVAATHLGQVMSHVSLVTADLHLVIWALAWDSHALLTQPWDLFHANAFHPVENALAFSEHFLGVVPLFAPTYWVTANPVLATNVTIVLTFALRGLAMATFLRRFVALPAAFLGGLLFGFAPNTLFGLHKFYLEALFYIPFAFWFTERWLADGRVRDAVGLAAMLALQAMVSFYLAFATAFAYGIYLTVTLAGVARDLDRRRLIGLALAGIAAVSVVGLFGLPYFSLEALGVLPDFSSDGFSSLGLVPKATKQMVSVFIRRGAGSWVTYALVLVGVGAAVRHSTRVAIAAIGLVAVGLVLAVGPQLTLFGTRVWTPYVALMEWLPGFSSVRVSGRLLCIALLGLCILAGLGAGFLLDRLGRRAGVPVIVALALLHLSLAGPDPVSVAPAPLGDRLPPVYRWLAENGDGGAVLELPRTSPSKAAERMLKSTSHWLPIVDGYSGHTLDSADFLHDIASRLPREPALRALLDAVDLQWIVLHESEMRRPERQPWSGPLPEGLEEVGKFGGSRLFRVMAAPRTNHRDRLLSTTVTYGGLSRAPLAARCPGTIELLDSPPVRIRPGGMVRFAVRISNLSDEPWPARGAVPVGLVRARVCAVGPRGRCTGKGIRLPADIPAGGAIRATLEARVPPGTRFLRIELFQAGGAELAQCGFRPVRIDLTPGAQRARPRARSGPG